MRFYIKRLTIIVNAIPLYFIIDPVRRLIMVDIDKLVIMITDFFSLTGWHHFKWSMIF